MSGTLRGTLFTTAKAGLGINTGTGSTLEVMSSDAVRAVTVSGYREALLAAHIPINRLNESEIGDRGNGYVTAIFQGDNYFTRFELNDMLHGLGWKMTGYTTAPDSEGITCHEMWTKHVKSKKHDK